MPRKEIPSVTVTFGQDERDLYERLQAFHKKTKLPIAVILKQSLRAAAFEEPSAQVIMGAYHSTFPRPGALRPAGALSALA